LPCAAVPVNYCIIRNGGGCFRRPVKVSATTSACVPVWHYSDSRSKLRITDRAGEIGFSMLQRTFPIWTMIRAKPLAHWGQSRRWSASDC